MNIDKKESYSIREVSVHLDKVILEESERLRKNLREKRKIFSSNKKIEYV